MDAVVVRQKRPADPEAKTAEPKRQMSDVGDYEIVREVAKHDIAAFLDGHLGRLPWHTCAWTGCRRRVLMGTSLCSDHVRQCAGCSRRLVTISALRYAVEFGDPLLEARHTLWFSAAAPRPVYCNECIKQRIQLDETECQQCSYAWHAKYPVTIFKCEIGAKGNDYTTRVSAICERVKCAYCNASLAQRARTLRGDVVEIGGVLVCGDCAGVSNQLHCDVAKCDRANPESTYVCLLDEYYMCTQHLCMPDQNWTGACFHCRKWVNLKGMPDGCGPDAGGNFIHFTCQHK